MNTEYYLPLSKFSVFWHAGFFSIWCQVFLYLCHRQCKQCISSLFSSQLQFSSGPTDQPSFLPLPFSCRAVSPAFLLPTSFLLWKQSKTKKCTYLFDLLLMFVPRLYSVPWRSHLESAKNSLQCREKSMVCKVLPVLRLPQWAGGVQNWFQLFLPFLARFHLKWAAWLKTLKRSQLCNVVRGSTKRAECSPC